VAWAAGGGAFALRVAAGLASGLGAAAAVTIGLTAA
jgi:hypothetical protein